MGNYRFRLSDMMPNAWFYKLRDMSKTKTKNTTTTTNNNNNNKTPSSGSYNYNSSSTTAPHHFSQPRNSFYYTPKVLQLDNSPHNFHYHHHHPPTKPPNRKTIYKPSTKHTESTHSITPSSESTQSELATASSSSWCTSCTCRLINSSNSDEIIIDKTHANYKNIHNLISPEIDLKLTPIITKPSARTTTTSGQITPARKSTSGVKVRGNSPKLAAMSKRSSVVEKRAQKKKKKVKKKKLSESFAIVKSSHDPEKDFMESMREMIVENKIRSSKELEELLACYLCLNSDEYHHVIVKAFEQIWFSLPRHL